MTTYYAYRDTVQDSEGRPVPGAVVTVSAYPSGTTTIYSDPDGLSVVNGVTTDANGFYEFFAPAGRYSVIVVANGIGTVTREPVDLVGAATFTATSGWIAPVSYGTGWAQTDAGTFGTVGSMVDAMGIAHLRGSIQQTDIGGAVDNTVICTLATGARPTYTVKSWAGSDLGSAGNVMVTITANGEVTLRFTGTAPATVQFNGISYPTASVSV